MWVRFDWLTLKIELTTASYKSRNSIYSIKNSHKVRRNPYNNLPHELTDDQALAHALLFTAISPMISPFHQAFTPTSLTVFINIVVAFSLLNSL